MNIFKISLALLFFVALTSCGNDTVVGSGLLNEDDVNIVYIDDIDMRAKTVEGDSVLTFNAANVDLTTYMMGRLEDPYFGITESEIFLTAGITGNVVLPNFEGIENTDVDSVMLVLTIDTTGLYGDSDASFDIEVFRVTETMWGRDSIYSNESFDFDMTPIGSLDNFTFNKNDTLEIIEFGDTLTRSPQIRIPIDFSIAEEIMDWVKTVGDSITLNDENFAGVLNGLRITATPSSSSMLAVDLNRFAYEAGLSELAIYFQNDTLENRKYGFSAGLIKTSHINIDHTGSSVEEAINGDFVFGDSLLFVQSTEGVNIEFDMSEVKMFQDGLLNHAELELTVSNIMGDDLENYPPIAILLASIENDEGRLVVIEDILEVTTPPFVEEFEENGITYYRYSILMTRYIQDLIKSTDNDKNLTISAILKPERPNRSIIYGPKHSTFPSKLKMTFTNP